MTMTILSLLCVGVPLAIVLFGIAAHARERRRMIEVAKVTPCAQCGMLLSEAAVAQADELLRAHYVALRAQDPDAKFRMYRLVRTLFAACVGCGARYDFQKAPGEFRRIEVRLAFETE